MAMQWAVKRRLRLAGMLVSGMVAVLAAGCASGPGPSRETPSATMVAGDFRGDRLYLALNRITWGVNASTAKQAEQLGWSQYLESQLRPKGELPAAIHQQIAAMTITRDNMVTLVRDLEQKRRDADTVKVDEDKKKAQAAYQQEMNRIAREAATRSMLRAVHSPDQLHEHMVWFWMNHFNVHQSKANLRAMVGDYEDNAIRPHALGKFRDLVSATLHHPAMIRYLDNEQNAVNRINENYARELMELHTMGVNGGYTQRDVQELARILTGVGVNLGTATPNVRNDLKAQYVKKGLWEFNPMRHDYGDKTLLGQTVKGRGPAELNQALDMLCSHPATARFVSNKLAQFFIADAPPAAVVARMAETFRRSEGDIAAVLRTLFASPEFADSLGKKFKDPVHYVVSAVRLAYDDKPILNAGPMLSWLNRMAEPLYGRQTPDGYALTAGAWASPGQMTTRFEIAKAIGGGSAGLFRSEGPAPVEKPAFPQLANALYYQHMQRTLGPSTRAALEQSGSPQEWNAFLLSSPEMMHR